MALARTEEFSKQENNIAEFARALAHPARLAILTTLAERRECICGDLVLDLPLAQSTVSQHLKALKQLGLIRGRLDGPKSRYCLDWAVFEKYCQAFGQWSDRLQRLRKLNLC